ncbi:MAG: hypothetical protein JW384_03864 [Nitrosomonadaceae bacterium]|nr:hypothetical protein [Nitrosomonadaceae bacterium]
MIPMTPEVIVTIFANRNMTLHYKSVGCSISELERKIGSSVVEQCYQPYLSDKAWKKFQNGDYTYRSTK